MIEGSRLRLLSALGGPVLGAGGAMLVVSWASSLGPGGGLAHRLLAPEGETWLRVVPGAIVFLFGWAVVDLIVKSLAIMRSRRSVAVARSVSAGTRDEVRGRAQTLAKASWPVLRSLGTRLGEVLNGGDPDRHYTQFRHECEIEAERGAGGYGLVRLFIWAMPILGFIGTVMGIGDAVSEFAGFLTGDIEDIEVVKTQLSNVSQGLSFAFDTTLLGLGASLVPMVLVSLVQRQEESILADVEQAGLALLDDGRSAALETPTVASVTQDAETLARTLGSVAAGFQEQTRALIEASRRLESEMPSLRASIDSHAQRVGGATVPRELMESVTSLRESSQAMLEASKLLTLAGEGRRGVGRGRADAPAPRVARHAQSVASAGTGEGVEPIFMKPARESFWRAPWTGGAEPTAENAMEGEPGGDSLASMAENAAEAQVSSRNRLAIMWGFGLLFLGSGSAVVAGWVVDRVLIPPDFALVSLILGATFWCMGALSDQS